MLDYLKFVLQLSSIILVIATAGLWAGAGLHFRPKNIDEQTLVGGTIWSQIIIPIGLLISQVVKEKLDRLVSGFYLITGVLLLWITGIVLIVSETLSYKKRRRQRAEGDEQQRYGLERKLDYNKEYYVIGVLCFLAGGVKFAEFILFVILGKE